MRLRSVSVLTCARAAVSASGPSATTVAPATTATPAAFLNPLRLMNPVRPDRSERVESVVVEESPFDRRLSGIRVVDAVAVLPEGRVGPQHAEACAERLVRGLAIELRDRVDERLELARGHDEEGIGVRAE